MQYAMGLEIWKKFKTLIYISYVSRDEKIRLYHVLFLLPLFVGIWEVWNWAKYFYAATFPVFFLIKRNKSIFIERPMLYFLIFLGITVLLNAMNYSHFYQIQQTDAWRIAVSFLMAAAILSVGANGKDLTVACLAGLIITYVWSMFSSPEKLELYGQSFLKGNFMIIFGLCGVRALLLKQYKSAAAITLLSLLFGQRSIWLGLGISWFITLMARLTNGYKFGFWLAGVAFLIFIGVQFIIAADPYAVYPLLGKIDSFSTGRSFFFSLVLESWGHNILAMFLPKYPGYSSEYISKFTLKMIDIMDLQCPHSVVLQYLIDYGILLFLLFLFGMFKMATGPAKLYVFYILFVNSTDCSFAKPEVASAFILLVTEMNRFIIDPWMKVRRQTTGAHFYSSVKGPPVGPNFGEIH